MKNSKSKLTLDELQVESFVTSISSEVSKHIAGGVLAHPTHTGATDRHAGCTCANRVQGPAFDL
ncbi:hypothetical protein ATE84_4714 [Aquimarina sp. MAR_2010_214]|uniref:pinensin family lanthipeptide n=1 Tax=Aquimarina sp. MAR_2010_214 TaxID=1250026 RepID=UPI000C7011E4|nr:pinensin family lanthipeptide [Aquimarina sp. MAR_2010_214]PKV52594.1 hypothetical protein ATE84_4714 [Aquimarina sp. MAR_2010_214]